MQKRFSEWDQTTDCSSKTEHFHLDFAPPSLSVSFSWVFFPSPLAFSSPPNLQRSHHTTLMQCAWWNSGWVNQRMFSTHVWQQLACSSLCFPHLSYRDVKKLPGSSCPSPMGPPVCPGDAQVGQTGWHSQDVKPHPRRPCCCGKGWLLVRFLPQARGPVPGGGGTKPWQPWCCGGRRDPGWQAGRQGWAHQADLAPRDKENELVVKSACFHQAATWSFGKRARSCCSWSHKDFLVVEESAGYEEAGGARIGATSSHRYAGRTVGKRGGDTNYRK